MDLVSLLDGKGALSDSSFTEAKAKEFNDEVKRAIDGVIRGIVGQHVLRSLCPYRLDTLFQTRMC
jgi:hypothetical protein